MLALIRQSGWPATVGGRGLRRLGPLRHRYGAARDLLLGCARRSMGRWCDPAGVIKNVAGYDLAKLFAVFGTPMVVEVAMRLHPSAGRRPSSAPARTPNSAGPCRTWRARRSS
jgi:hypothetical protein